MDKDFEIAPISNSNEFLDDLDIDLKDDEKDDSHDVDVKKRPIKTIFSFDAQGQIAAPGTKVVRKKKKSMSIISDTDMQSPVKPLAGDCSMVSSDKKGPPIDLTESHELLNIEDELKKPQDGRLVDFGGDIE